MNTRVRSPAPPMNGHRADEEQAVKAALEKLPLVNEALGLPAGKRIVAVVQRGQDDGAEYDLVMEDGTICGLGTRGRVFEPRTARPRIIAHVKQAVPWFSPKEFDPIATAIVAAGVPDRAGGGEAEETREWLEHLWSELGDQDVVDLRDPEKGSPRSSWITRSFGRPITVCTCAWAT